MRSKFGNLRALGVSALTGKAGINIQKTVLSRLLAVILDRQAGLRRVPPEHNQMNTVVHDEAFVHRAITKRSTLCKEL